MRGNYNSPYSNKNSINLGLRSQRTHQYLLEQAKRVRKKVGLYFFILLFFFLFYLFFYSQLFQIKHINVTGSASEGLEEQIKFVQNQISNGHSFIFRQNNFFSVSKAKLNKDFQEIYTLSELQIDKKFPSTLDVVIIEKLGQSVWLTNERAFIIDFKGLVQREIPLASLTTIKVPIIYDLSNTYVGLNDSTLEPKVMELIYALYQEFPSYQLPAIDLDYFKIDNPKANYIKIVTKQGFEIHLNTILDLQQQILKLKKSLEAGLIDLKAINYINLRIEDQVIYK